MSDGMKSVLITGGASGIGLEIARLLHERGWRVYLMDRNADALADACRAIPIDPAQAIACSVTDEKEVESAIATAAAAGAPLRAVINSAGIAMDRPAVETSVDDFRRILDVNLTGTFIVCREAARHWLATATPGAIVNISSVSGLVGNKDAPPMAPPKARSTCSLTFSRPSSDRMEFASTPSLRCNRHAFVARRPYG